METIATGTAITTLPTDLKTVSKEPGIGDLPIRVRGPFANAVIAERQGNHELAQEKLEKALAMEAQLHAEEAA